jgi:hypothetical protein
VGCVVWVEGGTRKSWNIGNIGVGGSDAAWDRQIRAKTNVPGNVPNVPEGGNICRVNEINGLAGGFGGKRVVKLLIYIYIIGVACKCLIFKECSNVPNVPILESY